MKRTGNLEKFYFDVGKRIQWSHVLERSRNGVIPQAKHQLHVHASTQV